MSLGKNSILKNISHAQPSGTVSTSQLKPSSGSNKIALAANLTLTSLVDCFTILVVYLLVATSFGSEEMKVSKDMQLPEAIYSNDLSGSPIARVEGTEYYFDDKKMSLEEMFPLLQKAAVDSEAIVIQADKKNDYAKVNPMVLSALQAGFKKVKLAVLKIDER